MMKKAIFLTVVIIGLIFVVKMSKKEDTANNVDVPTATSAVNVTPISHASMILSWDGVAIYTDPVGDAKMFEGKPAPDIILLTDIHGDHLDAERLNTVAAGKTIIIAPQAVLDDLNSKSSKFENDNFIVLHNGEELEDLGFKIEAIPMYNLPGSSENYHIKGRGNGYIIEKDGIRVYISGDTAGIPEMRNLKDIDIAFVAMNLPYTMGVEEAADAVLAFKPKKVYPYHYRTPDGFSDVVKFKTLVNAGSPDIEVVQLEWYPE